MAKSLDLVFLLVVFAAIEVHTLPDLNDDEELPLSKSLGYAVKRSLGKTLEDKKISKEYLELYQEMLKASRESYEKVDEEEAKLETIVGREKAELMKKANIPQPSGTSTEDQKHKDRARSKRGTNPLKRMLRKKMSIRSYLTPYKITKLLLFVMG